MRNNRGILLILATILSLLLVACGSADDAGGADSIDLPQTLTYEDELGAIVTINYPEGWVANSDNGSATMASSEDLLELAESADVPEVPSGGVLALSLALPSEMASFFVDEGEEVSAAAMANAFLDQLITDPEEVSEVEETTLGERAAAVVQGTSEGTDVVLITIALGEGNFALVFGATAEGEGDSVRPTIEAIAGSIQYAAMAEEESE